MRMVAVLGVGERSVKSGNAKACRHTEEHRDSTNGISSSTFSIIYAPSKDRSRGDFVSLSHGHGTSVVASK
jgi:hypothetical protein